MATAIADAMWDWSNAGALPVVIDAVSCLTAYWTMYEPTSTPSDKSGSTRSRFRRDRLGSPTTPKPPHQTKAVQRGGTSHMLHDSSRSRKKLIEIVSAIAHEVIVPIGTTCCGTAGDRGLLHPELVVSATREEKAYLDTHPTESTVSEPNL